MNGASAKRRTKTTLRTHQLAGVALPLSVRCGTAMFAREELAPGRRQSALVATIACAGVGFAGAVRPRLFARVQ